MLRKEVRDILEDSQEAGWVLEPRAKRLLALSGLAVPKFKWIREVDEAAGLSEQIGTPMVVKVVSPSVVHKSDVGGVLTGIDDDESLAKAFHRFSKLEGFTGMLVEQMVSGIELIVGAKMDYQFGPVILLGMGGTGVEIYEDTVLRMAPLRERDVGSMVRGLRARKMLEGYRGSDPVNLQNLTRLLLVFSKLVMQLQDSIESIDLNPVKCSPERCVVADARIVLKALNPSADVY